MSDDYSNKERYWQRRRIAEALFKRAHEAIPDLKTLVTQWAQLNKKIVDRHERIRYLCTYAVRDGQEDCDFESEERGGYTDTWLQRDHLNLPRNADGNNGDDDVPRPGKPMKVQLHPHSGSLGMGTLTEWTKCIHPECVKSWKDISFSPGVIFLFCKEHADMKRIEAIEKFIFNAEEFKDGDPTRDIVNAHLTFLEKKIRSSYTDAILHASICLDTNEQPAKVIEVECLPHPEVDDDEEVKIYIDLTDIETMDVFFF